jgi:membrane protein required for colicin V production
MIDVGTVFLLVMAATKGFNKGLIMAVFSFAAFIIGLAAALKLSAFAANYLMESDTVPSQWVPILAFLAVFLAVVILVQMAGKVLEKTIDITMLGWLNKAGGFMIYALMYLLMYSVILFYARQMHLISERSISESVTGSYIEPWGPWVIDGLGRLIPSFKDIFNDLQQFFGEAGEKIGK